MSETIQARVQGPVYGGAFHVSGANATVSLVLPGELVQASHEGALLRVIEPSPHRVTPRCPHFGTCGGCQYQMAPANQQLDWKAAVLQGLLREHGVAYPGELNTHGAEPYSYRNRIRLRVERAGGVHRVGYNVRGTTAFLPIVACPISAPPLVPLAQALLALAETDRDAEHWLHAAHELELFANDGCTNVQATLFCAARTKAPQGSLTRVWNAWRRAAPQVAGLAAEAFDPRTGPTGRTLDAAGATGLSYRIELNGQADESYWISRGGFFQVNRFLVPKLVELVTAGRSGALAWDLFAGVGLFSRVLARSFSQVTAVEASPMAAADLRGALAKLGKQHRAVAQSTLEFLRSAAVQRERPDLIVLDPPRAGAGMEACDLLLKLAAREIVYVSCDPTTLARDLRVLQAGGYRVVSLDVVDLFPQTFHLESVAVLRRPPA